MTYFLQKTFTLNSDGILTPSIYGYCLIRPCKLEYSKILDYTLSTKSICLEGSIAMLQDFKLQDFNSVEEWIIWLSLNKNIMPDFEETCIYKYNNYHEYVVKLVDLHTQKVLYDRIDETVAYLSNL